MHKVLGWIKQGAGPDSAHGACVCHLCFRERGREKEHRCEREASIGFLLSVPGLREGTHNLGMCPDRESNLHPLGYRMVTGQCYNQLSHTIQGKRCHLDKDLKEARE